MNHIRTFFASSFLLIFSVWSVSAQGECALDVSSIIERVNNECADIGENEVCYGNRNVNVTPRLNLPTFEFDSPGDLADLYNIQSLVVDAVDPSSDTWGVAQMRLLVGSTGGLQDITMLLFGEFDIENAVEDTPTLDLIVQTSQKTVHLSPDTASATVETVAGGAVLTGLARLVDTAWIRVENPETRRVGWIENSGIGIVEESLSTGILPIQDERTPYFGAMQAFYFQSGQTDIGCDTVESDGMLIQTPEGEARISLLINEVSIELTGGFNNEGERESGTALIQANPLAGQELNVNVLGGNATVQTNEGTQEVTSGQRTTIPLSVDLRSPIGAPQPPSASPSSAVNVAPLLPAVSAPRENAASNSGGIGNGNSVIGNNPVGSGNGNNNGTNNNTGNNNTGNTNNTGGNTATGNNGNNSGSGGFNIGGNSNNDDTNTGTASDNNSGGSGTFQTNDGVQEEREQFGFGQQGNIIALGVAIGSMVLFLFFIVRSARQRA